VDDRFFWKFSEQKENAGDQILKVTSIVDMLKIKKAVEAEYNETCEDCFAHWVNCLWFKYPGFSFEENKEAFFWLLEKLLREGKVKFRHPEDPWNTYGMVWNVPIGEKISYLRSKWPVSAKDELDADLNMYFYEIPAIVWLGEDGKWYSS
jgi:hypothetical protein